jgi:hypothetical protein
MTNSKKKIIIFLISVFFLTVVNSKSFSQDDVFIIKDVSVQGKINTNFLRDKYINKAFKKSFKMLMTKIILSEDLKIIKDLNLSEIKKLVRSFQVEEEKIKKGIYQAKINVFYHPKKVKNFLSKKNISFAQPDNISAVFFPILFIDDEMQDFDNNYFYQNWTKIKIKNESINFLLPLEDLDDISKIKEIKNNYEKINIEAFINKYNTKNYAFVMLDYNNKKLKAHIKTSFDNNKINKNVSYILDNIKNEKEINKILRNLKVKINDIWKENNIINLLMPLSIKVKVDHLNLKNLDKIKKIFSKITIIDSYSLEEFNIKYSFFKLDYFGSPKKLKVELLKFGYDLNNDKGYWELSFNG